MSERQRFMDAAMMALWASGNGSPKDCVGDAVRLWEAREADRVANEPAQPESAPKTTQDLGPLVDALAKVWADFAWSDPAQEQKLESAIEAVISARRSAAPVEVVK